MKRSLRFVASLAILICVSIDCGCRNSAQQSPSAGIVGRWFSLETSKGGIGQICEFRADGTFDYSIGAVVNMPWRIEKNELIFPPDTIDGPEQKNALKWIGDNKLRLETEWSVTELSRVGSRSDSGNPLIGEWIEKRQMDGRTLEARYFFYARGEVLLLIPFTTEHGSYSISGSALHLKIPGQEKPDSKFRVVNNVLTFSGPEDGKEYRFARY